MRMFRWWPITLPLAVLGTQGCSTLPQMVCPKEWDWDAIAQVQLVNDTIVKVRDSGGLEEQKFLTGPGETQNTAEFHDCQAFITDQSFLDPDQFSNGVFAIFAVRRRETPESPYAPAIQRAVFQAHFNDSSQALPAAQIFARAAYPPLGINPGFNCLYLMPGVSRWAAALRSDGWEEWDCSQPIPVDSFGAIASGASPLSVHRQTGRDWRDYPVVARWHWYHNQRGSQQYRMGVWCDQGWCEVGPGPTVLVTESFARETLETATFSNGDRIMGTAQGQVPGWYDEQVLAVYERESLNVGEFVGTIIPDPALGTYTDATFADNTWLPAAMVALTPLNRAQPQNKFSYSGPNPFRDKFNFDVTPPFSQTASSGGPTPAVPAPLNAVFLCRGTWDWCISRETSPPENAPSLHPDQLHLDGEEWWAKLEGLPGSQRPPMYLSVARCPYDFQVAGTARWRWLPDDPGLWMRCIDGCCEVRGDKEN